MSASQKPINSWQVAATYIGTVVGAGFASGQETLRFFAAYGSYGLLGIVVASLGFGCFGAFILYLGNRLVACSYSEIFVETCGSGLGKLLDLVVTFFLFGAIVIMLAGVGAIFEEHLGIAKLWGVLATSLLALFTVYRGLAGVMSANVLLIPLMVALTFGISAYSLQYHGVHITNLVTPVQVAVAPHWLLAAVLYISYNLLLSVPVLAPMGSVIQRPRVLMMGGLMGGLGLGLLSCLLALVLMVHFPRIAFYEIPMLYIVRPYADIFRLLFAFILWVEVFTTLIANLYGFAQRVSHQLGYNYHRTTTCSLLAAVALSGIGFSTLVGTVYPFLGYLGLVFLTGLVVSLAKFSFGKR